MKDFNRIVVVTAQHGEKFLGWVPKGVVPGEYLEKPSIVLHDVRLLATQQQPKLNAAQQVVGMSVLIALLQIDMFPGPVPTMHLHPSSWYFPFENPKTEKKIKQLIDAAEQNEKVNQAIEAGVHVLGRS
jgi:hypothetical protein